MNDLPASWTALCAVVFLLGLRHGVDADHLAAIDGLTRLAARRRRPHARFCGALFSAGHGGVVLAVALGVGLLGARWAPPAWFETLGAAISVGFLTLVGLVNLRAVLRAPAGMPVPPVGIRGRLLRHLRGRPDRRSGALAVAGVGTLFALSFDTLSQAALFALMAVRFGGVAHAAMLGLLFALGMLLAGAANGWWMARLIARTDRLAVVASRTMTLVVGCTSLLVAALGAARLISVRLDGWLEGRGAALGMAVVAFAAIGYLLACHRSRASGAGQPA